ncbi:SDR family oxidoreductase [Nocardia sp. NBC_00416]|uniref:SDR family oxidoreductase n=1 Tax=Nocardia sp. NBC_00416 TaxID=2975991 RepID=UPI002E1B82D9
MRTAVLVTGATGAVGRRVVDGLAAGGAEVRAVSRDPSTAGLPSDVECVAAQQPFGDLLAGMHAALVNVTALGLGDPAVDPVRRLDELVAAAHAHGTTRLVLLSSASALDPDSPIGAGYRPLENRIEQFTGNVTVLRPTLFASNTAHWWAAGIQQARSAGAPYADVAIAPIDERDVADAITAALLRAARPGRSDHLLTGPERLTPRELVAIIAGLLGTDIAFDEVPPAVVRRELLDAGAAEWAVDGLLRSFEYAGSEPIAISDALQQFTGRAPRTYAEWVADHLTLFR